MNKRFIDLNSKITLEIIVNSNCNLNCANCDHFAPIADNYFIDSNYIDTTFNIIKKELPNLNRIVLIGGEPLLNKELVNICISIRKFYNDIDIEILTNGILLNKISDKDKEFYRNLRIRFEITPYPINIDYAKIENNLKYSNIEYSMNSSRFIFGHYLPDINGAQDKEKSFYNCGKFNLPVLTLFKNKIYYCPFSYGSQFIGIPETENDYIKLEDLSLNNLISFCNTPKDKCKYCKNKLDSTLWHLSSKSKEEFIISMKNYFLYSYSEYEKIINNKEFIDSFLDNYFFLDKMDCNYQAKKSYDNIIRFKKSKIDIIIPFYKVNEILIDNLEKNLCSQTFIKNCTIYLISDNSPNEGEVFDRFYNHNTLNCVILKSLERKGPGNARNIGIKNSYGEFIFFLDFDDTITNTNTLERLYKEAINLNRKIVYGKVQEFSKLGEKEDIISCSKGLISKECITTNNLLFPNLYIGEDYYFYNLLNYIESNNIYHNGEVIYNYNRNINNNNLGSEFHNNMAINTILSQYILLYKENFDKDKFNELIENILKTYIDYCDFLYNNDFYNFELFFILTLYIFYNLKNKNELKDFSNYYNNNIFIKLLFSKVYKNDWSIKLNNIYLNDIKEIEDYLFKELNKKNDLAINSALKYLK